MNQLAQDIEMVFQTKLLETNDSEFTTFAHNEWNLHRKDLVTMVINKYMSGGFGWGGSLPSKQAVIAESIDRIIKQMQEKFLELRRQKEYFYASPTVFRPPVESLVAIAQSYVEEVSRFLIGIHEQFNRPLSGAALQEQIWQITQYLFQLKQAKYQRFYFQVWYEQSTHTVCVHLFDQFDMIPEDKQVFGILVKTKDQPKVNPEPTTDKSFLSIFKGILLDEDHLPKEGNVRGDTFVIKGGNVMIYTGERFEEYDPFKLNIRTPDNPISVAPDGDLFSEIPKEEEVRTVKKVIRRSRRPTPPNDNHPVDERFVDLLQILRFFKDNGWNTVTSSVLIQLMGLRSVVVNSTIALAVRHGYVNHSTDSRQKEHYRGAFGGVYEITEQGMELIKDQNRSYGTFEHVFKQIIGACDQDLQDKLFELINGEENVVPYHATSNRVSRLMGIRLANYYGGFQNEKPRYTLTLTPFGQWFRNRIREERTTHEN